MDDVPSLRFLKSGGVDAEAELVALVEASAGDARFVAACGRVIAVGEQLAETPRLADGWYHRPTATCRAVHDGVAAFYAVRGSNPVTVALLHIGRYRSQEEKSAADRAARERNAML